MSSHETFNYYIWKDKEDVGVHKDTLDEIQAKMKNTVLRNAIVWSNTSPQDVPNAMKQNNFTLHPIVTLPDLEDAGGGNYV